MRSLFLLWLFGLFGCSLSAQTGTEKLEVLGFWHDTSLIGALGLNLRYSSCWGMAVNGREYAIAGGAQKIIVLDITNPAKPTEVAAFMGSATTIREFKSYKNRLYGVAGGGSEGLSIIDFSEAPDTIRRTYYSNEYFNFSHTITLDTISGKIYLNGSDAAIDGVLILDVSQNPDKPERVAAVPLAGEYVHDAYIRNDTFYASSGFEGLIIFDLADPQNPKEIARTQTGGYNHNSWPTSNGDYLYYTEEIPVGQPVQIVDLRQLKMGEIENIGNFLYRSLPESVPSAPIPHNLYIAKDRLFLSQYEEGLLMYDISQPEYPVLLDVYDTHPQNTMYAGYYGNWGNYPWLPSGNIVSTDMQNGVFVFRVKSIVNTKTAQDDWNFTISPNPASDQVSIKINGPESQQYTYKLNNLTGQTVLSGQWIETASEMPLNIASLANGVYLFSIQNEYGDTKTLKVLKI